MKAIELQNAFGIDNLNVVDRPEPRPGFGQVMIRMTAWSLNYRDLMVVKGQYNPKIKFPIVPLSDGAGEVAALGEGCTRFKVGDRVAGCFMPGWIDGELTEAKGRSALGGGGPGMLAEYVTLPEDGLVTTPKHLRDEEAAALPCAAVTAWHALVSAGEVKAGDTVLTQGTGGVSLFAVQFARLLGARVIATSGSDEKLSRVLQLGASDGINYKTTPEWGARARELTGFGVDHVVEVGGAGTLAESLRAVRTGGTISLIGVLSGVGQVNPLPILMKGVRVQGIYVGSREMFEAMNRAVSLHKMTPVIDRVFEFTEIRAALRHLESGAHFGKVCVRRPLAA
jgi:NADPH:quinone reductase-like Zn-dependent oxidoreductase